MAEPARASTQGSDPQPVDMADVARDLLEASALLRRAWLALLSLPAPAAEPLRATPEDWKDRVRAFLATEEAAKLGRANKLNAQIIAAKICAPAGHPGGLGCIGRFMRALGYNKVCFGDGPAFYARRPGPAKASIAAPRGGASA